MVDDARDAARDAGPRRSARHATFTLAATPRAVATIAFEEAALGDAAAFDSVKNVVTSASAAKLKNSHKWLGKIGANVYVTRNEHDGTLNAVKSNGPFIGLGKAQALVTSGPADGVFYLDVTNQEVSHPYFYARQSVNDGRAHLRDKFFGPLYAGKPLKTASFELAVPGSTVYKLK